MDLKVDSFPDAAGSRWLAWQVEYPGSRSTTQDTETEIRLVLEDLGGIVPLAMVSGAARQHNTHTAQMAGDSSSWRGR